MSSTKDSFYVCLNILILHFVLFIYFSGAQVAIVQSECLFGELSRFTLDHCETLQSCMRRVKEDQRKVWQSILTQATQNIPEHDSPSSTSYQFRSPQSHMNSEVMGKLPPILVQEYVTCVNYKIFFKFIFLI